MGGAALRRGSLDRGLLRAVRANLLHVRSEESRLDAEVALLPYENALGPDVDVDPREVPVEQAANGLRRVEGSGRGQLAMLSRA